jgi:hypothetical protein
MSLHEKETAQQEGSGGGWAVMLINKHWLGDGQSNIMDRGKDPTIVHSAESSQKEPIKSKPAQTCTWHRHAAQTRSSHYASCAAYCRVLPP